MPALFHSDLRVVDDDLRTKAESFWAYQAIAPALGRKLRTALMNATVTGCATAVNRALVALALPVPDDCVMHDWWCNLVAAAFGEVDFTPQPTMLYRQHGANAAGARAMDAMSMLRRSGKLAVVRHGLRNRQAQAAVFLMRFADQLPAEQRAMVAIFTAMAGRGFLARRLLCLRHGFLYHGLSRNLALLAAM